jgi:hypothetical protein
MALLCSKLLLGRQFRFFLCLPLHLLCGFLLLDIASDRSSDSRQPGH